MAAVTYDHVTKCFGDVIAVNDLCLKVRDTEFLVLVGPSGCGKSTALRLLAGLEETTEGTIYIGDRPVNDVAPKDRDIAMVFQSYALYPHMKVYDNLAFGLRLRKTPSQEIHRRVKEAAATLGIEPLLDRKPKALSGGQRQRVALGRAIVREPAVFLFDEPLSNLDAKLRVQTRAEITKLHKRLGTTFLYVTHDQIEAMTMADRIAIICEGALQQLDSPQAIYEHPRTTFVASFLGSPPMNLLDSALTGSQEELFLQTDTFRFRVPEGKREKLRSHLGEQVIVGIRPEDIHHPGSVPPDLCGVEVAARVDVTELMGNEIAVHLTSGKNSFVARVDPRSGVFPGAEATVVMNMDKIHVFDARTQEAIPT